MKRTMIAAALVLALSAPAYAHKDMEPNGGPLVTGIARPSNNPACTLEQTIQTHDGFSQVRAAPNLLGEPLWELTNGSRVTFCGVVRFDRSGRAWHYVRFITEADPSQHAGWVVARLLTAAPQTPPEPAPPSPPVVVMPPAPAAPPAPPVTNNYNFTVPGEPPFDPSACIAVTTMSSAFPVYAEPNGDSGVISDLQVNDQICVLSAGEWTHVHFKKAGVPVDG